MFSFPASSPVVPGASSRGLAYCLGRFRCLLVADGRRPTVSVAGTRWAVRAAMVAAAVAALGAATAATPAQAATITVTNVSDVNAGSLRRALEDAEQLPDRDTIKFDIPGGGAHTITLVGDLPVLSYPVTIRGYSQPGAVQATDTDPAQPTIEIDASQVGRGLEISSDGVEVRGLAIHSAQDANIFIEGGDENILAGNHLGTNLAGDAVVPAPTRYNVNVYGSDNLVGGPRAADRNVIAGALAEVTAKGGPIEIQNNRIGTSADGTADLGCCTGVLLGLGAGESVVRDNLVSGLAVGIDVAGDHNTLQGNRVGTNADGDSEIPNGVGVNVEGGDDNTIGGTGAGEGNVISGNAYEGLKLEHGDDAPIEEVGPAEGNQVLGNLIGVDHSGAVPLRNGSQGGYPGIAISSADANTIGGQAPGAGNVIAANAGNGLEISGDRNLVLGNAIGTNMSGALGLGNGRNGVQILAGDANDIGNALGASMNTIAYNGEDGVAISNSAAGNTAASNTVVRNLIFVNGTSIDDLGIDLAADGVTENDREDGDAGPNDLLNHPLVTAAHAADGTVDWTLEGLPSTRYRLEFYASPICDGSGSGEGQHYLGHVNIATDPDGLAAGTAATTTPSAPGDYVAMTATRTTFTVTGPIPTPFTTELHETSEFSPCEVAG